LAYHHLTVGIPSVSRRRPEDGPRFRLLSATLTMTQFQRQSVAAPPSKSEPDAHGQAALLLVESLIHMLIEHEVLSLEQAVEVIEIAAEVKTEVAAAAGESKTRMNESLALLADMATSLESDRL